MLSKRRKVTKLEDGTYADLRDDDPELERIEQEASAKMASFPALTRDVFQSFYSLMPRQQETGLLHLLRLRRLGIAQGIAKL